MKSGSPAQPVLRRRTAGSIGRHRIFLREMPLHNFAKFPDRKRITHHQNAGRRTLGTAFADFCLPFATRTKEPTPTTKARGNSAAWSSGDQSLLTRIFGVSGFILELDVRLEIDQSGIIPGFHSFPNSLFQFVQLAVCKFFRCGSEAFAFSARYRPGASRVFGSPNIAPAISFVNLVDIADEIFLVWQQFV